MGASESIPLKALPHSSSDMLRNHEIRDKYNKSSGWLQKVTPGSREADPTSVKNRDPVMSRSKIRRIRQENVLVAPKMIIEKREAVSTCSTFTADSDSDSLGFANSRDESCFYRVFPKSVQDGVNKRTNDHFSPDHYVPSQVRHRKAHPMPPKFITTRFHHHRAIPKISSRRLPRAKASAKHVSHAKPSMCKSNVIARNIPKERSERPRHTGGPRLSENQHSIAIHNRLQFLHIHSETKDSSTSSPSECSFQGDVQSREDSSLPATPPPDPTCNRESRKVFIDKLSTKERQERALLNRVCAAVLNHESQNPGKDIAPDCPNSYLSSDLSRGNTFRSTNQKYIVNKVQGAVNDAHVHHKAPQHHGEKTNGTSNVSVLSKSESDSLSDSHHSRNSAAVDCPPRRRIASNDGTVILSDEEDAFHGHMREKMYSRATWNMYDRITRARAIKVQTSITGNRVPNHASMLQHGDSDVASCTDIASLYPATNGPTIVRDLSNGALFSLEMND
eukprot:CAMPEP_0194369266 /NCGR_PEP_ID=MMETSP0174-20130528/17545_1 /TAXON_ID=216777 /ORGANISM="Proboscia alata, Strain PI-D3" /LENGTH=504 /DNA_ID=CAMNT_0039146101 /DNA_START=56 /DNA_END=1570 /DNA_ORIENTATION=+